MNMGQFLLSVKELAAFHKVSFRQSHKRRKQMLNIVCTTH